MISKVPIDLICMFLVTLVGKFSDIYFFNFYAFIYNLSSSLAISNSYYHCHHTQSGWQDLNSSTTAIASFLSSVHALTYPVCFFQSNAGYCSSHTHIQKCSICSPLPGHSWKQQVTSIQTYPPPLLSSNLLLLLMFLTTCVHVQVVSFCYSHPTQPHPFSEAQIKFHPFSFQFSRDHIIIRCSFIFFNFYGFVFFSGEHLSIHILFRYLVTMICR